MIIIINSSILNFFPLDDEANTPIRRGVRNRTKPKKYGDFVAASPSKRTVLEDIISSDDEETEEGASTLKPTGNIHNVDCKIIKS